MHDQRLGEVLAGVGVTRAQREGRLEVLDGSRVALRVCVAVQLRNTNTEIHHVCVCLCASHGTRSKPVIFQLNGRCQNTLVAFRYFTHMY